MQPSDPERVTAYLRAHEQGIENVFAFVKSDRPLSKSYIKELHALLTAEQETTPGKNEFGDLIQMPLLKGAWKTRPNNPTREDGSVHRYCPPEHVESEMDNLIALHTQHIKNLVPPDIESAWLHHRFTQIHPFQDGNGRVARALASFVLVRAGWFPLVYVADERAAYIKALEDADAGDLGGLVRLFAFCQKRAFIEAFQAETVLFEPATQNDDIQTKEKIREMVSYALLQMKNRTGTDGEWSNCFETARQLRALAVTTFSSIAAQIEEALKTESREYFADVETTDAGEGFNSFDYQQNIRIVGREQHYFADNLTHSTWVRLLIGEQRLTEIVVHFHGFGVRFIGIMACSAFVLIRDSDRFNQNLKVLGPYALTNQVFTFSYNEPLEQIQERFRRWLNLVAQDGVSQWSFRV